jgi:hypothetical protein
MLAAQLSTGYVAPSAVAGTAADAQTVMRQADRAGVKLRGRAPVAVLPVPVAFAPPGTV